jgi:hypothetical protein
MTMGQLIQLERILLTDQRLESFLLSVQVRVRLEALIERLCLKSAAILHICRIFLGKTLLSCLAQIWSCTAAPALSERIETAH